MSPSIPVQPDPRVMAMISTALDNGLYEPHTQIALVQCFSAVFGQTQWWRDMLAQEPGIAQLVHLATKQVMH